MGPVLLILNMAVGTISFQHHVSFRKNVSSHDAATFLTTQNRHFSKKNRINQDSNRQSPALFGVGVPLASDTAVAAVNINTVNQCKSLDASRYSDCLAVHIFVLRMG